MPPRRRCRRLPRSARGSSGPRRATRCSTAAPRRSRPATRPPSPLGDGEDRRRGRTPDGRARLLRLRPRRMADAHFDRAQAARLPGHAPPRARVPGSPRRALPRPRPRGWLPSTPLKETERRRDRWLAAKGVEQTEIDALAALNPDLLQRIARRAIGSFFDSSRERHVNEARTAYLEAAQEALEEQLDREESLVRAQFRPESDALASVNRAVESRLGVVVVVPWRRREMPAQRSEAPMNHAMGM